MNAVPGTGVGDRADEIVVAVDGSRAGRAALSWAVREARSRGRRVTAVRAFDPASLYASSPLPVAESIAHARGAAREALRQAVADAVGPAEEAGVHEELLQGDPATEIARRSEGAAVLVMGSHGRSRIGTTLLGSVSAACVRRAGCPVLIMPPKAADAVLSDTSTARGADVPV